MVQILDKNANRVKRRISDISVLFLSFLIHLRKSEKINPILSTSLSDISPITPYGMLVNCSLWLFIISYWFLAGHHRKQPHSTTGIGFGWEFHGLP